MWFLRSLGVAWQPVCRTGLGFRDASKTNIKDEQKTVLKLVLKRGARRWRESSFLWLTPYALKTLRSDGEQLNGNQVKNALSPPLTASLAPGSTPGALALLVHVWRNACGISSLAALVPVFLGGFFYGASGSQSNSNHRGHRI